MMKQLMIFLLAVALVSFSSCKGDEGSPGPAGVAGATGPMGPTGPVGPAGQDGQDGQNGQNGQNGQDGQDGNANVKIYTKDFLASDFITAADPALKYLDITMPEITQEIHDNGFVMAYIKVSAASDTWTPLPCYFANNNQSYYFWTTTGLLRLHVSSLFGSPETENGTLKIVIATADGLMHNPDLDWTDYDQVIEALSLVE